MHYRRLLGTCIPSKLVQVVVVLSDDIQQAHLCGKHGLIRRVFFVSKSLFIHFHIKSAVHLWLTTDLAVHTFESTKPVQPVDPHATRTWFAPHAVIEPPDGNATNHLKWSPTDKPLRSMPCWFQSAPVHANIRTWPGDRHWLRRVLHSCRGTQTWSQCYRKQAWEGRKVWVQQREGIDWD